MPRYYVSASGLYIIRQHEDGSCVFMVANDHRGPLSTTQLIGSDVPITALELRLRYGNLRILLTD